MGWILGRYWVDLGVSKRSEDEIPSGMFRDTFNFKLTKNLLIVIYNTFEDIISV
jgi:hypothetical protein